MADTLGDLWIAFTGCEDKGPLEAVPNSNSWHMIHLEAVLSWSHAKRQSRDSVDATCGSASPDESQMEEYLSYDIPENLFKSIIWQTSISRLGVPWRFLTRHSWLSWLSTVYWLLTAAIVVSTRMQTDVLSRHLNWTHSSAWHPWIISKVLEIIIT